MPLASGQLLKYNGTKWTNSLVNISEVTGVTLTTPSAGQVLSFNGTNWVNTNSSSNSLQTNTTTTSIDLNTFTTNTYTNYTSSSITVSNGPAQIVNPVTTGLVVLVETNGVFFTQSVYIRREAYVRSGNLADISSINWYNLYANSSVSDYYEIMDGLNTPPLAASNGERYYVMPSATGLWSAYSTGSIAVYDATNAIWTNETLVDGKKVVLLSPTNLNVLSSGYYTTGVVYTYSPLVAAPSVTGVFLVSVGNVVSATTTSPSVSELKVSKLVSLTQRRQILGASFNSFIAFIDENGILYHNGATQNAKEAYSSIDVTTFGNSNAILSKRIYRQVNTEKVRDCFIGGAIYSITLMQDNTLILVLSTHSTNTFVNYQTGLATLAASTFVSNMYTVLSNSVTQIFYDTAPMPRGIAAVVGNARTSEVPGLNFMYQKTNGKVVAFGQNGGMAGRGTDSHLGITTINYTCSFTAGSNIVTILTAAGTSELAGGEPITALTNYVPANTFVGSFINGNQITMVNANGLAANATLTSASQSVAFNIVNGRTAAVYTATSCATTSGSTTVTMLAADVTRIAAGGRLYHTNFPGGMVTFVSVLTSTTIQVSVAATATGSSLTITVDQLTGNLKKLLYVSAYNPLVAALTTNNNLLAWGAQTLSTTPTNLTSFFPGITDLLHISTGNLYSIQDDDKGFWWRAGTVDRYSTWGGSGNGNGVGIGTTPTTAPFLNTYGIASTANTNPTNILVTRTVNSGAISSGVSTITTAANVTGMSTGFTISGTGIPANTFVGAVTSATSFTIVDANGVAVVTTQAIPSNTVLSYSMLSSGESIQQVDYSLNITAVNTDSAMSPLRYILTSNGRLFTFGTAGDYRVEFYLGAPTLVDRNVVNMYSQYSAFRNNILYQKTDGWLYAIVLRRPGENAMNHLTPLTIVNYTPVRTYYNTASYGAIKECKDGYILTTSGDLWMFHNKGGIRKYYESPAVMGD